MTFPGETISTGAPSHEEDPAVTPIKVMMSAAGYYVGTGYIDPEFGFEEPNTRESECYYPTEKDAQYALDTDTYPKRG